MRYEIVVGAASSRDSARFVGTASPSIAAGSRSYERIAIVEQTMSLMGQQWPFMTFSKSLNR
jgi:hypothetical protein